MKVIFDDVRELNLAQKCFESGELFTAWVDSLDIFLPATKTELVKATGKMTPYAQELFAHQAVLRPIETAPRDDTWIILFGPSGYTTTPMRCAVGHYDPEYRPLNPWQTHSQDAFTDGGPPPTHWMPLPEMPK